MQIPSFNYKQKLTFCFIGYLIGFKFKNPTYRVSFLYKMSNKMFFAFGTVLTPELSSMTFTRRKLQIVPKTT